MALVTKNFTLNVTPGAMPPTIHVSEYDVGRTYTITLLDENGSAFEIPTGTTAAVEGTLNGTVGFTTSATISNNQISFALTESMTAYSGKAWCKIKLTLNDEPIQTCAFILAVDRAGAEADTVIGAPGFEEQIAEAAGAWLEDQGFTSPTIGVTEITGGHRVTVTDYQGLESFDVMDGEDTGVEVDATLFVAGKAADAAATGAQLFESSLFEEGEWEAGTIDSTNGTPITGNARIRTKSYVDNTKPKLEAAEGYSFFVAAYSQSGTFVGCWNGSTFVKAPQSVTFVDSFDMRPYEQYRFKIAAKKTDGSSITTADSQNIQYRYPRIEDLTERVLSLENKQIETDKTLSIEGAAADAKVVGDNLISAYPFEVYKWEAGTIDSTNGTPGTGNARIRTKDFIAAGVLKVEASEGYSFFVVAYSQSGDFVGCWNGSTFVKAPQTVTFVDSFDMRPYEQYRFKIVAKKTDGSSIAAAEAENIRYTAIRFLPIEAIVDKYFTSSDGDDTSRIDVLWESGSIDGSDGSNITSTTRIRSSFITGNTDKLSVKEGYAALVYLWSGSTYTGLWNGSTFSNKAPFARVTSFDFDFSNLRKYKVVLLKTDESSIATSDAENIEFLDASSTGIDSVIKDTADLKEKAETLEATNSVLLGNAAVHNNDTVFSMGYMYVRFYDGAFHFSDDGGRTYGKSISPPQNFGTLRNVWAFKNGTLLICDHTKAYYTDDWTTWHESTCLDIDGSTYVPTQYDTFTNAYKVRRVFAGNNEIYVFGNYNITDESNNRELIWYTTDNGHTLKVAYEFNKTGSWSIRHVHTVVYCEAQDCFWICTGDSSSESRLIKGFYTAATDEWRFELVQTGLDYKWSGLAFFKDRFYYCYDNTPGRVMEGKIGDEADLSKHRMILGNLPNDAIGLFIGQQTGEMLVSISAYRSGTTTSTNAATYDSKCLWYSSDRENFVMIDGNKIEDIAAATNSSFFLFCGPNADGKILASFEPSSGSGGSFITRDMVPGRFLDEIVKACGYNCNFK